MKSIELFTIDVKKLFPEKIHVSTSNGNYEMNFSECQKNPPKLEVIYHHSTPTESADVLSDAEPDYFGMDIHIQKIEDKFELIVDITYGDSMMFSFKIKPDGKVEVGHYNGHGSKFDPNYEFYLHEETIKDFINSFNKMNLGRCNQIYNLCYRYFYCIYVHGVSEINDNLNVSDNLSFITIYDKFQIKK